MSACQVPSGLWQEDCWGALRSTLNGPRAPAVASFPAVSKKSWDPVKALGSSLPSATDVDSVAVAEPEMPEPVSAAEQPIETLLACQPVG